MPKFHRGRLAVLAAGLTLAGCDALDTSALRDIEETAQSARLTVEGLNARATDVQGVIDDPLGTLKAAALGATFTKTATAEPNLFVLTDLQTGCQWLATYDDRGETVSLAPRTEPGGEATRQRCISVGGSEAGQGDPGACTGG